MAAAGLCQPKRRVSFTPVDIECSCTNVPFSRAAAYFLLKHLSKPNVNLRGKSANDQAIKTLAKERERCKKYENVTPELTLEELRDIKKKLDGLKLPEDVDSLRKSGHDQGLVDALASLTGVSAQTIDSEMRNNGMKAQL